MYSVSRLLVLLVLLTIAGRLAAEPPADPPASEPPSLYQLARNAIKKDSVDRTRMLGISELDKQFQETPAEGGVLVGFDLGVGNFQKRDDAIYAVRPIYRTERGEFLFQKFGLFGNERSADGTQSKVLRTVKVKAKSGYAVGAITLRIATRIRGMSVTFMKLDGAKLDPRQSYTSDWVGMRTGGKEETATGNGTPIVGVFGNRDDHELLGLGLVKLSGASSTEKPPAETREMPTDPPEAKDRERSKGAKDKKTKPKKQDGTEDDPDEPEEMAEEPLLEKAEGTNWIPYMVFGVLTVPIGLLLLLTRGRKSAAAATDTEAMQPEILRGKPKVDPHNALRSEYEKLVSSSTSGFATASLTMGVFGLFAWCLPIVGVPLTITGLVMGVRAVNSEYQSKAIIGIVFNCIGLLLAIGYAAFGFMMVFKGKSPMIK